MERSVLFGKVVLTAVVFAVFAGVAVGASERVSGDTRTFTVKLQIDKPYCVLNFMETLRTRGYYGPTLYEHYKKSEYREDEELSKLVQQYSSVRITYGYHFDGYPKYRYMAKDRVTSDVFFTLSARTESLEEFKQMTVGIIPFDDHQRLFEILEAVEPIYDELVWDPYYGKAQARLKGLKEYAEKVNLGEKLRPVAHFLNSSWSADVPVIVSFSIVPGEKIKLVSPPIGNVIRKNIVGPMMYEVGSGITDDNIDALMAYDFTKVIVITKDHERAIEYLKGKVSALDGFDGLDAGADWVLSCHGADLNPYVIVNIQSVEAFEEVTKKLKAAEMIDPNNAILYIGR